MVHKCSLAHLRACLAYEEYGEERSRPTDCRVVQEHRKARESRELTLDSTTLCLGKYPDRLPRGEASRTQHIRHAYPTCHTSSDTRNLSTQLSSNPRGGLRASRVARAQQEHSPSLPQLRIMGVMSTCMPTGEASPRASPSPDEEPRRKRERRRTLQCPDGLHPKKSLPEHNG